MRLRKWSALWVLVGLAFVASCSQPEKDVCGRSDDCPENQLCREGVCVAPDQTTCNGDPDCPGGYQCQAGVCERIPLPDAGDASDDDDSADTGTRSEEDTSEHDRDDEPPEVVAVEPADGSLDVAVDAAATVTFNEAMRDTTINLQSVEIRGPSGDAVPTEVSYDPETFTATIDPTEPLRQATGYRLVVTLFVRDEAGNTLTQEHVTRFYTRYDEPEELRAIAEIYAPIVYQALGRTSGTGPNEDIPTRVDFDGNWKARDNRSKASVAAVRSKAHVYYNVVASKTHYFITYTMYYPIRSSSSAQTEHEFTGAVFVLDKETGALKLVEGVKVQSGNDTAIAFKPSDSDASRLGESPSLQTFDASVLENGRYPMFITDGEHEACNWLVEGPSLPVVCRHNAGEFPGEGVVLSPGESAQHFGEAVVNEETGLMEMTYALVPLASTLWMRRDDVGRDELWEQVSAYRPEGEDRPATLPGSETPIMLPNRLVSDDDPSLGKPPFAWLKLSTRNNPGQWLLDPAFLLATRYDFGENFSDEYCYNVFLSIDRRGDANAPECQTP